MAKPLTCYLSGNSIDLLSAGYGDNLEKLNQVQKLDLMMLIIENLFASLTDMEDEDSESGLPAYVLVQDDCKNSDAFAYDLIRAIAAQLPDSPAQAIAFQADSVEVAGMTVEVGNEV